MRSGQQPLSRPQHHESGEGSLEVGVEIWIPCESRVWRAGVVTALGDEASTGSCEVETTDSNGRKQKVRVPLQHGVAGRSQPYLVRNENLLGREGCLQSQDLSLLSLLHEAALLHALQTRFDAGVIYTLSGPVLLAVNPFREIPQLYSQEQLQYFAQLETGENCEVPHIYGVGRAAYEGIHCKRASQTILVSGESGAGKTETTKFVMRFLALAGAGWAHDAMSTVERRVLESIPLLEALGNAKTLRNDNSSRFGKYTELQFGHDHGASTTAAPRLMGAKTHTYLLEKVRVVCPHEGERSFHIFYQILAAAQHQKGVKTSCDGKLEGICLDGVIGRRVSDFRFLNSSSCSTLAGHDEAEDFTKSLEALRAFEIPNGEISEILAAVMAVLYLGNITFQAPTNNSEGSEVVSTDKATSPAAIASSLLGVQTDALEATLCQKTIKVKDGQIDRTITQSRTVSQAADGRDALARHLYGAVFHFVVSKINDVLQQGTCSEGRQSSSLPFVGALDIFGFEFFQTNSFEQLCINFTNELLQQYFNEVIFEFEQELYVREGIKWNPQDFPDNKDIVTLLMGDGRDILSGVLPMLDEECNVANGTPGSWCRKMAARYGTKSKLFQPVKTRQGSFVIQHFAGPVEYNSEAFLSKNKDSLSADAVECMKASTRDFVRQRFQEHDRQFGTQTSTSGRVTRVKAYSVSSEFRQQLQTLMRSIRATVPHFVRCIKPNPRNNANEFHRPSVVEQLRYQGVLQAIEVSRAGYPIRLRHREAVFTYRQLAVKKLRRSLEVEVARGAFAGAATRLFRELQVSFDLSEHHLQVGASRVFLKRKAADVLDIAVRRVRATSALQLQTAWRSSLCRRRYMKIRRATIRLQASARCFAACRLAKKLRQHRAAVRLQTFQRGRSARARAERRLIALYTVQRYLRAHCARRRFLRVIRSVVTIQRWLRSAIRAAVVQRRVQAALVLQCTWRRFLGCRCMKKWRRAKQRRDRAAKKLLWRWRFRTLDKIRARLRDDEAAPRDAPIELPGKPGELIAAMRALEYQHMAMVYGLKTYESSCQNLQVALQTTPWTAYRKTATRLWMCFSGNCRRRMVDVDVRATGCFVPPP